MTRVCFVLLALAAGCASATRSQSLNAELAVAAARAVVQARKPVPKPSVPDGVCARCVGRGFIGDNASIREVCPECKGTGKATKAACVSGTCGVRR